MKYLPVTGFLVLVLLFAGLGFVASDAGPQAAAVERPALNYVQEAHVGHYEEHLARLALQETTCR